VMVVGIDMGLALAAAPILNTELSNSVCGRISSPSSSLVRYESISRNSIMRRAFLILGDRWVKGERSNGVLTC
jgi:hypothetical protein